MTGDPLHPDEIVYRRIPRNCLPRPKHESIPAWVAFRPNDDDLTGLSLSREEHESIEQAAQGMPGKRYHVARMRVRDLNEVGLSVIADEPETNPGHAIIPELSLGAYRANRKKCKALANLIVSSIAEIVLVALDPDEYPDLPDLHAAP